MDGYAKSDRNRVKQNLPGRRHYVQLHQRIANDGDADQRVYHAIDAELSQGNGELSINRLQQHEVQFTCPDQLRQIGQVDVKEPLEDLADDLVGTNQKDHIP